MLNKSDLADPETVRRMRRSIPGLVVASAKTGEGIPELLAAIEASLPKPAVAVDVVVPYDRGDLVARVHEEETSP